MSVCIALRDDYDSIELRCLAKHSRDPRQVRRLLALAAVYDGMSRAEAAKVGGMDRQTLRDWAHRFNDEGADGLTNRAGAGRPRLLSDEQMGELSVIVETGPDPVVDGVVRWRRIDLKRVIEERFGVTYCQWRSKKGPPWRCKKGPLGGCGLVPVVHGRAPRATRRALNRPTRRRAREGPVGPRGQAWAGWSVQFAVGV